MKKSIWMILALILGVTLAVPAAMGAALVTKGSSQIAISGVLDFDTEEGAQSKFDLLYGYFFIDRLALGPRLKFSDDGISTKGSIGLFSEYNFKLPENWKPLFGTDLVPYLGIGGDYVFAEYFNEHLNAAVLNGELGLKFFLTDSTAISVSMVGELASEDIYSESPEGTNKDLVFKLGMGLYF